jgi:membrane-associated protease RseP (regulator of RpoE activity)
LLQLSVHILITFVLAQPPVGSDVNPARPASKPASTDIETTPGQPVQPRAQPDPSTDRVNYLGVRTRPVSPSLASQLVDVLPKSVGLEVDQLQPGSPASAAGIQKHDLLVKFGNLDIRNVPQLKQLVIRAAPGETVKLTILRAGRIQTIDVTLRTRTVQTRPGPGKFPRSMANTGLAVSGPQPTGRPRYFCSVEVIQEAADRFHVTVKRCEGGPEAKDEFTGAIDEIADHFEKSPASVRNNISACFQALHPDHGTKRRSSVRVVPRIEGKYRFVRFTSIRKTKAGFLSIYVYDKRLATSAQTLAGVADEKEVQDELKKLPTAVGRRIDQTIRQFKGAVSSGSP